MRAPTLILSALLAALLVAAPASAQPFGPRTQGAARLYDPATVTTVRGTVIEVQHETSGPGQAVGIHVLLRTGDETVPVHLGPAFFLASQDLTVEVGDDLEVVGSRVTYAGAPALIAREVRLGERQFRLRDEAGLPAWRGTGPMSGRRMRS